MSSYSSLKTYLVVGGALMVLLVAVLTGYQPARQRVAGLFDTQFSQHSPQDFVPSGAPIDAVTLAGQPGLYYRNAANLTGVIDPKLFSAYQDLVEEGQIPADATILTDADKDQILKQVQDDIVGDQDGSIAVTGELEKLRQDLNQLTTINQPNLITQITSGLGLSGGGSSGQVTLSIVVGEGIVLKNGAVTAILGNNVDLLSEISGVLPVANGGTGRSAMLSANQLLMSDGVSYVGATLAAGDGLALTTATNTFTFALDNTVCRTTGNCDAVNGITGTGAAGQLAFFTNTSTLASDSALFWDNTSKRLGLGTTEPTAALHVAGNITSPGAGEQSEKFGLEAVADGNRSIAIGHAAFTNSFGSIVIGASARADDGLESYYSIVIGHAARADGGGESVAIGHSSNARGDTSIAIGPSADTTASHSISLGADALADEEYSLVAGSNVFPINNLYFGKGRRNAVPTAYTINGTGGSGTDIAGGGLRLAGGRATGNALGGDIEFQTADVGVSGATLQALSTKMILKSNGRLGLGTSDPQAALHVAGNITSPGSGVNSEKFGLGASAGGNSSLAVGYNAQTSTNSTGNIAIGYQAKAIGGGSTVVIGGGATANYFRSVIIGANATALHDGSVAIGNGASSHMNSLALGANASATAQRSIALGREAIADEVSALIAGSSSYPIENLYFGKGRLNASPTAYTINGTGGSGTDIAGGGLRLAGGRATGNALGGDIEFQTSDAGVSGATLQGLTTKMILKSDGAVGIGMANPTAKLHLSGTSGPWNEIFKLTNYYASFIVNGLGMIEAKGSGGTSAPWFEFHDGATSTNYFLINPNSANSGNLFHVQKDGISQFVVDGNGLVGIGVADPSSKLQIDGGGILITGTTGSTPTSGAGTRLMWIPEKAAFRAGAVIGSQWDNASIGSHSTAFGLSNTASGIYSAAFGQGTTASGNYSSVFGQGNVASGAYSAAFGDDTDATGSYSVSFGSSTTASGYYSASFGYVTTASGLYSTAFGTRVSAGGRLAFAVGENVNVGNVANSIVLGKGFDSTNPLLNNTPSSLMVGFNSNIPTLFVGPSSGLNTAGNIGIGTTNTVSALTLAAGTTSAEGITFGADTNLYRAAADTLKTDDLLVVGSGLQIGNGVVVKGHLSATVAWDPANVVSGAVVTTTVTVTGAKLGDVVGTSFNQALPVGVTLSGSVTAVDTLTVTLVNLSGADQDLPSGTVRATITQY